MARPSFNNIGLRRDLNLSDLSNPQLALNNLLNNLVVTEEENVTFSGGDLDAIKGISNSTVTNQDIASMAGLAVKQSYLDPEDNEIKEEVARPNITVKNQLDTITATTNDPPFFNGGDGLFADFYEFDQINSNPGINTGGVAIRNGNPVVTKKYWQNGLFEFSNKLDDTLGGANGLIQWQGYYVPDSSGTSTFNISCTGLFMLEIGNEFGQFEISKNIYKADRRVFTTAATITDDRVSISAQEANTVVIRDQVTAIFDDNGVSQYETEIEQGIFVDGVGSEVMVLTQELSLGVGWRIDLSIQEILGVEEWRFSKALTGLEKYVPIPVRFTLWFPGDDDVNYFNKTLDANLSTIQRPSSGSFPYWYLYSELGEISGDESFKGFYDRRLLLGGGTIGPEDPINSSQYNRFLSISPLTMNYIPPKYKSQILRGDYRYSTIAESEVISVTSTSPYTDDLEIGNKIIANSIDGIAEITDLAKNNIVISSITADSDATLQIEFIDHRGYRFTDTCTSSNETVTVSGTTDGITKGDIVITNSYAGTDYIRVTSVVSVKQFTTSINLNISSLERIYIYSSKGLNNRALDNFCIGVVGKEVAVTIPVSSFPTQYITLNNVLDLAVGQVVYSRPYTDAVDENDPTTLTKIAEINPAGYPNNTVRLTKTVSDTDDMVAGITVVFAPSSTTQNKEACVIPLNTAPPFVGTLDGLRTTDGTGGIIGLELTDSAAVLRVKSFILETTSSIVELPAAGTQNFDRAVPIIVGGVNYKVLATTSGS